MNAKEVRIGNLVNLIQGFRESPIEIQHYDIDHIVNNSKHNKYEPIPLTEEWLLKFGFIKDEDLGDMVYYQMPENKSGYGVCFDHDEIVLYHYNILGITNLIYDSEYFQNVHQLQNLYFSLTGEELIIKNP